MMRLIYCCDIYLVLDVVRKPNPMIINSGRNLLWICFSFSGARKLAHFRTSLSYSTSTSDLRLQEVNWENLDDAK